MSEGENNTDERVKQAAGIVAASQNKVGISKAMELVGFSQTQRRQMKLYQQVRRKAKTLLVVDKGEAPPLPVAVEAQAPSSEISSLTSGTREESPESETRSQSSARRSLVLAVTPQRGQNSVEKGKASRKSSREVQRENAITAEAKERDREGMKVATRLIQRNNSLPTKERKANAIIVRQVNQRYNSSISSKLLLVMFVKG